MDKQNKICKYNSSLSYSSKYVIKHKLTETMFPMRIFSVRVSVLLYEIEDVTGMGRMKS